MDELFSLGADEASEGSAERLIAEFGTLGGALAARPEAQLRAIGCSRSVALLGTVRAIMLEALKAEAFAGPVLTSSNAVADYLTMMIGRAEVEEVRALFLSADKRLIRDELMHRGTPIEAPLCTQAILRRALELRAAGLILAHNHPSGDARPSRGDIEATRELIQGGRSLGIKVHDHLIVAQTGWTSLRELGLL